MIINAEPVLIIVDFIASTLLMPCLNSFLYRSRKCKLSSTAIPSATAKVMAVGGRIEIPNQAIAPSIVKIGIRFVTRLAKRIGYIVTTTVTAGLGKSGQDRNIKYWTYHHDDKHYAIVLINAQVLEELGFGF